MIKFSIITTARGRLDIFPDICNQIWSLAHNPDEIEHIVMYDHDDIELEKFLIYYMNQVKNVKIYSVKINNNNKNLHRDYWNVAAKISKGDVVFGLCNDTKLLTPNYDKIILDSVFSFKNENCHNVCQILIDDDSSSSDNLLANEFCSWVVLTRSAVDAIGGIVPDEIYAANGDRVVYDLFKSIPYNCFINLREVIKTHHLSHYTKRRKFDRVSVGIKINSNYLTNQQFENYRLKLLKTIEDQINAN